VLALRQRGYRDAGAMLEHEATGRLATMRMVAPHPREDGIVVDLIFASTGIEPEIVEAATPIDVLPGVTVNGQKNLAAELDRLCAAARLEP